MDPIVYLSSLSTAELEVEYLVRGLVSNSNGAKQLLVNCLLAENACSKQKPEITHEKENTNIELQICATRYEELSKATTDKGLSPSIECVTMALAKIIHYKNRTERLIRSIDEQPRLNNTYSNFRRLYNWCMKLMDEFKKPNTATESNRTQSEHLSTSSPIAGSSRNINNEQSKDDHSEHSLGDIQRLSNDEIQKKLQMDHTQLKSSVADFFAQAENRLNVNNNLEKLITPNLTNQDVEPLAYINKQDVGVRNVKSTNFNQQHHFNLPRQTTISQQNLLMDSYKIRQRWKLSFDGSNKTNVHDFLYRLEQMALNDEFPQELLPRVVHYFLSNTAEDWYWIYKQDHANTTWLDMKDAMRSFFCSSNFDEETQEQIIRRFQASKEPFSDFVLAIQKLNSRLQHRLTEKKIIYRLCQNMVPALRNVTLPFHNTIRSVEELRRICQNYEKMWEETGYDPRRFEATPKRRPVINEIFTPNQILTRSTSLVSTSTSPDQYESQSTRQHPNEEVNEVEAFQAGGASANKPTMLVCWNCKDLGHRYQDCNKEFLDVFCFGCGAENVRKPACQNCLLYSTKNMRSSAGMSRDLHWGRKA